MTIKEAATLYGVSPQAIYQRLKSKGVDIRAIKTKTGELTPDGERILGDLFDRTSVTGDGEQTESPRDQGQTKQEEALNAQLEMLKAEVDFLKAQVELLKEERDYLRRALDQSQQLQAMTMRMLPPAPAERRSVFSWLTSRFTKPAPASDQQKPEETL